MSRTASIVVSGVTSLGFATTVLPVSSAGASLRQSTASGKFHGQIATTTPTGARSRWIDLARRVAGEDLALEPAIPLGVVAAGQPAAKSTSPAAWAAGLPTSCTSRLASSGCARPGGRRSPGGARRGPTGGVSAQAGCASRAARRARSTSPSVELGSSASVDSVAWVDDGERRARRGAPLAVDVLRPGNGLSHGRATHGGFLVFAGSQSLIEKV